MSILIFIFGLIIGSFLNVVIYRLPLTIKGQAISIIHPVHSMCPTCKMRLYIWELVPLFSFIFQLGKCTHCQQKISWQYPLIEFFCGLIALAFFLRFGLGSELWFYLGFVYLATALLLIDFKHQLLPDVLTLGLLYLGLLFHLQDGIALSAGVLGVVVGYLSLWSIYWLFKLVSGKEGFGYGDFKLTAALGAWLGWQALPMLLSISAGLALIFALFNQIKTDQTFAFGPFLLLVGTGLLFMHKILL